MQQKETAAVGHVAGAPSDDGDAAVHKAYRIRWLVMLIFCMASASNAVLWITFAPINSLVQEFYACSAAAVNALSLVYLIAYVPFSIVANLVFKKQGMYRAIVLAVFLDFLSSLLRFLSAASNAEPRGGSDTGYALLLSGQTLGAMAQPLLTNAPALMASRWFPTKERDVAAVVMSLANPVGIAIGSVLPTFYVIGDDAGVRMYDLLLVEMGVMAAIFILALIFFAEKPELHPSHSETLKATQQELPLRSELGLMLSNRDYRILFVCFGVGLGFFNALTTLVEQFVNKSGYTSDDAGLFSGLLIGTGIISAIIIGLVLDRVHKYNFVLKLLFVFGGTFVIIFVLVLRPNNMPVLAFTFAGMGSAMLPLLPVVFQCAAECTYPLREDLTTGGIMSAGQVTGVVFIVVLGEMVDAQPVYDGYVFEPAYILIVVCIVSCVLGILLYNGSYHRLKADQDPLSPASTIA
ncbi:Feline leukemia virus subgroup C receptor-related protein 1 [Hondaea fermentalgiana]|uniref:Feline leukemia virus subgroup C receptor-related protein 1 n=1 Tax=Hondaea fermentalgiana TaxID=2315210 RepID=A0A2R5G4H0_9STRA|nr:Feline leukemia virus subgroup C receptor-related protein 1 [Hondaea fermentalgiana]|eukprot:GBG25455.1 Feline leukemia virus subgroup C receptor-related protein 1 [Hondaea fermentalgiana]